VTPLDVLDPRTLAASASMAGLVFSSVLWGSMRDGDPIVGAREWFYAAFLISVSLATNSMQDMLPDVLSRVVANVGLVAACFLLWQGARRYNGRASVVATIWAVSVIAFIANLALTAVWPSAQYRIAITSFGLLCGALLAAYEIRRAHENAPHLRFGVGVASWPLVLFACFMALRTVNALLGAQTTTSLVQNPINVATHLIGNLVLLTTLAGLTIIVNATRAAQVRSLAYTDLLTGVLSRRGFYSAIGAKGRRPFNSGNLFVFDIDRFKVANDLKGHETGDTLLKLLADTIRDHASPNALVARFGGDEFVVLTDDRTDAPAFADAVRSAFRERSRTVLDGSTLFGRGKSTLATTEVSVGYAACASVEEPALSQALRSADRAMYESKIRQREQRPT
jgi:diguanylate cyclase (GGDEF)-like protein